MKDKILNNLFLIISLVFIFLAPIVFLPFFTDPYDFGRQIFVLVFGFIVFVSFAVRSFFEKKLVLRKNSYFLPIILLLVAFTASSLISTPNKLLSLSSPFGPASILLMLIILAISSNLPRPKLALYTLLASGSILSLFEMVLFFGKFNYPLNIPFLNLAITKAWSPTGSPVSQAILFLMLIPVGFSLIYEEVQKRNLKIATLAFLANSIVLAGLGITIYLLGTEAKPILLPQETAWAIAAESIKQVKFAILGVGPGQFIDAFTAFKPISFNNTDLWNLRFGISSNWYFQLLTEVGFLGLLLYLNLAIMVLKNTLLSIRETKVSPLNLGIYIALTLLLVAQLFVPINLALLVAFAILLGLIETKEEKTVIDFVPMGNSVVVFFAIPVIVWGVLLFFGGKIALANNYFLESIKAVNQNDGIKAYNMQIRAIQTDPSVSTYHIAYSQTNFALANSLAAKKDLTDDDRNTITQLVQQSLREAKAAVALDSSSAVAWENLSNLYSNLINFAQGADSWAVASYQEAIKSDPLNPKLRIDLGGIYYSQKNYNQAASFFLQATNLKPDFANAHYNLANALRELGALAEAKKEYEVTQTLVKVDSNDYEKVTAELEEVKKRMPTPTPAPVTQKPGKPETLSTPQVPSTGIKPPLNLPNEGPPVSSTPEAEASPTTAPTTIPIP